MKEIKEEQEIYNEIKKEIDNISDIFESDTFIASVYLLKYLDDGDIKYYYKFLNKMEKLDFEDKKQVFLNVINNLRENKNKKEDIKHNKVKVKTKDGSKK